MRRLSFSSSLVGYVRATVLLVVGFSSQSHAEELALNLRLVGGGKFHNDLGVEGANELTRWSKKERYLRNSCESYWITISNGHADKPKQCPIEYALQFRGSSNALPITIHNDAIVRSNNRLSYHVMAVTSVNYAVRPIIFP
jgi:hypothetical protein